MGKLDPGSAPESDVWSLGEEGGRSVARGGCAEPGRGRGHPGPFQPRGPGVKKRSDRLSTVRLRDTKLLKG